MDEIARFRHAVDVLVSELLDVLVQAANKRGISVSESLRERLHEEIATSIQLGIGR